MKKKEFIAYLEKTKRAAADAHCEESRYGSHMSDIVTIHVCPNGCKNTTFNTPVPVMQDWDVDAFGNYVDCTSECSQVIHGPDNGNSWTCNECGAEADMLECRRISVDLPVPKAGPDSGVFRPLELYVECNTPLGKTPRAFVEEPGIAGLTEYKVAQDPDGTWYIRVEEEKIKLN